MNVLVIHTYYFPDVLGGAEYSVKKISEGLASRGNNVHVLCDTNGMNIDEVINGVSVHRRKMRTLRTQNSFLRKIIRAVMEIYNILNVPLIIKIFKLLKNDKTICYTNSLRRISRIVWVLAKIYKIPIIDTQREYRMLRLLPGNSFLNKVWLYLNRTASTLVNYSAFVSKASMNIHLKSNLFRRSKKYVVYNSIDYDPIQLQALIADKLLTSSRSHKFKFVYLGSLEKHKGIDILLEAYNSLYHVNKNIELHIAGEGSMKNQIKDYINTNTSVTFYGWLSEENVCALLQSVDVLVCPSIWEEPFGRVVLDAYKNGIPAIVSKAGGLSETVIDNITGFLVAPGDVNQLYMAMKRISEDRELYKQLCNNIPNQIIKYSIENQLDAIENIMKSAI